MTKPTNHTELDNILDKHAEYYIRETMKFFQETGENPALSKLNKGDTEAEAAILANYISHKEVEEAIGEDEQLITSYSIELKNSIPRARNRLRSELRKKLGL